VAIAQRPDVIFTSFGDMMRVPGSRTDLLSVKAGGGDVRMVYSPLDAVKLAQRNPDKQVVFFAVGFETTACTTAAAVLADPPDNFSILTSHRLIPPALIALLKMPSLRTDGFLLPGHVLAVTGTADYEPIAAESGRPMAVAGFEPVDILLGLVRLCELALARDPTVDNSYPRVVRREGNLRALAITDQAFVAADATWRGLGVIPDSGLVLRDNLRQLDALQRFEILPDPDLPDSLPGCQCGQVMVGLTEPEACALFGTSCTPDSPRGPCMVSFEGTCRNRYLYQEV